MAAPEKAAEAVDLSYAEFSARFGGAEIALEALRRAVSSGLVELRESGVHVADDAQAARSGGADRADAASSGRVG